MRVLTTSIGDVVSAAVKPAAMEDTTCSGIPSDIKSAFSSVCFTWSYVGTYEQRTSLQLSVYGVDSGNKMEAVVSIGGPRTCSAWCAVIV